MAKLEVFPRRTLKLTNVVAKMVDNEDTSQMDKVVEMMDNYIKTKGSCPIGPLIHKVCADISEEGEVIATVDCMRQCESHIHRVEAPYTTIPILKISNCLYLRFVGPENDVQYGYDKLRLYAYEEDIRLKKESYTVFLGQEGDTITVDLFIEREDEV